MMSMLHQRGGYAATSVMDPQSMSVIHYSDSDDDEMTKPLNDTTSCTETLGTISPHERSIDTSRRISIHTRLRNIVGDMWTEEQLLQKFTFGRVIGSGATSQVYSAHDHDTGQYVAIKVFDKASMIEVRRSMVADGAYVQEKAVHRVRRRLLKILSELEISKSLLHPNIIRYLGAYETEHRLCIVYELVDGCDLLEYLLKHGKMDETVAASIFKQLLLALDYCHRQHLYHRDLKLENVLITKDFQVKLIDFGLSERVPLGVTLKTICGTPLYCAPEVLFMHSTNTKDGGFHGGPADVWSIGILIFALLTGCAPFDDSNFTRLRNDVQRHRIAYPGYLSNTVKGLLKLVLIFDPTLRPTVQDLLSYEWIQNAAFGTTEETVEDPVEIEVYTPPSSPISVWTPRSKGGKARTWSNSDTATTSASSSESFEDEPELRKISEEPHELDSPTHLSLLEHELEQMLQT